MMPKRIFGDDGRNFDIGGAASSEGDSQCGLGDRQGGWQGGARVA